MIRTEDLWKRYRGHDAVRGISFSVPEGSAYALIGANGAGKTTTLKILMNILEPTSGSATVLGMDSRRITHRELNRIGYVSENQQMPERLTVEEYFGYLRPFYMRGPPAESSLRAQLRLPATRRIGELSHGMRMKMALACTLPFRPDVLILDEPFSGLDPLVRDEFMDGVLGQAGETTILMSTHELGEVEGVATPRRISRRRQATVRRADGATSQEIPCYPHRLRPCRAGASRTIAGLVSSSPPTATRCEFIDSRFAEDFSHERLNARFHGIRSIETEPVPLRTIFTALARAARNAA